MNYSEKLTVLLIESDIVIKDDNDVEINNRTEVLIKLAEQTVECLQKTSFKPVIPLLLKEDDQVAKDKNCEDVTIDDVKFLAQAIVSAVHPSTEETVQIPTHRLKEFDLVLRDLLIPIRIDYNRAIEPKTTSDSVWYQEALMLCEKVAGIINEKLPDLASNIKDSIEKELKNSMSLVSSSVDENIETIREKGQDLVDAPKSDKVKDFVKLMVFPYLEIFRNRHNPLFKETLAYMDLFHIHRPKK